MSGRHAPVVAPEAPVLWTADEAAAWLRCSRAAVYARAERGRLPGARRDGRRLLVVRDELVAAVLQERLPTTEVDR